MPWSPAHEAHAIERVSASIFFSEAVPTKGWAVISAKAQVAFQNAGFTTITPPIATPVPGLGQPFQIMIGPNGVQTAGGEGRIYQVLDGVDLREEVHLFRDRLVYNATRYAGWASFWGRIESLILPLFEDFNALVNPSIAKLEYWDRFNFDGNPSDVNFRELISPISKYMPAFLAESTDLVHAHIGYFDAAPAGHKRLVNANADAIDLMVPSSEGELKPVRSLGLYSLVQDQLTQDRGSVFGKPELISTFDELHTTLKDVVGDIITSDMADRISLKAPE